VGNVSCWHSALVETWQPSCWIEYEDDLLGLRDKIWAKGHPLTGLNLIQWGAIVTSIECFKGRHLEILLVIVFVRELTQWQTVDQVSTKQS
jgi:hypothetical protein